MSETTENRTPGPESDPRTITGQRRVIGDGFAECHADLKAAFSKAPWLLDVMTAIAEAGYGRRDEAEQS